MIKFIKRTLLFFVIISIIDVACGYGFKYLRARAKGGETQKNYYISEICNDDILILGSSRAAKHYIPRVIQDSIGLSCYNCGEPGCGIITAFARYRMIEKRHKPRLVVYETTPSFDYLKTDDYSKYLGRVRQDANKEPVRQVYLELGDNLERFRLMSNMYINNSFLIQNLIDVFTVSIYDGGFDPLFGVLSTDIKAKKQEIDRPIDSIKMSYIEKLILDMREDSVPICFVVSPNYVSWEESRVQINEYKPIIDLCEKYRIPFIDHLYMDGISNNRSLFQDVGHMNQKGALLYSRIICDDLKKYINCSSN